MIFERGASFSFANCGLPYAIGNVVAERDQLFVQTAEGLSQRFNLDIRTLSEVTAINRHKRTVTVRQLESGHSYEESYYPQTPISGIA